MTATGCGSEALKQTGGGQGGGGGHGAGGVKDGGATGAGAAGQGGLATTSAGGSPGGAAGAGGASPTNDGVACLPVTGPLITDFSYLPDGGSTTTVHFGDDTATFSGSEFVYPTSGYVVTSDVTGNNWHISGVIGDYSGFGLSFDGCSHVDASAYKGISFTLSGVVAAGSTVTMGVGTLDDTIAASWLNAHGGTAAVDAPGRCIPTSGTDLYTQSSCTDPTDPIPVTSIPTTINVMWSDFSFGKPEASVNPGDILTIYWSFPPPPGVGTSGVITYTADITIDNLQFIQ